MWQFDLKNQSFSGSKVPIASITDSVRSFSSLYSITFPHLICSSTPKIKGTDSSKMLVPASQTTRHQIPDDYNLNAREFV